MKWLKDLIKRIFIKKKHSEKITLVAIESVEQVRLFTANGANCNSLAFTSLIASTGVTTNSAGLVKCTGAY